MAPQTANNKTYYLTEEGLQKAKEELNNLINVTRNEVSEQIAEAKAYGDLSENAEYEQAKERQAFVEGRIAELQVMIKHAQIISPHEKGGKVVIGSEVKVNIDGDKLSYTIVGSAEANPLEGKISNESPIGMALLGSKKGDMVKADTPRGALNITIDNIL